MSSPTQPKARRRPGEGPLEAADWTEAALDVLAHGGIEAVRIESLSKQLKVTKGSFYWHFKNRQALLEATLAAWRKTATLSIIERLSERTRSPAERLQHLLGLPFHGRRSGWGADVELAIRLWGRHDKEARTTLAEVDQLRLRYIRDLLAESSVPQSEIQARAVIIYSYIRVAATLVAKEQSDLLRLCENLLLGPPGFTSKARHKR